MSEPYNALRRHGRWQSRFLDTIGDGTGSRNAAVDGSVVPVDFKVTAETGTILLVNTLMVFIKDTSRMDADRYGNGIALPVGIQAGRTDALGAFTPAEDITIKTNADWGALCFDTGFLNFGQGDEIFVARYSFLNDGAPSFFQEGESLCIRIQDDLTALSGHTFRVGAVVCPK